MKETVNVSLNNRFEKKKTVGVALVRITGKNF